MAEDDDKNEQPDKDVHVRNLFDRMTRGYLLSVLSDELIEEHRRGDLGHVSEPLARLLAWCQRRPPGEQYAVKAEADGSFRLIRFAGRRGRPPDYIGDERYATLQAARHGAFLRHVGDLTEK
jgi:hypothetical protein